MSNLQPFQYPVPEGFEVVTRSGEKVTQLTKFECNNIYPVIGVLSNNLIQSWTHEGFCSDQVPQNNDLLIRPIPRERWVVVVERAGSNWAAGIEESEKNAELSQEKMLNIYPDSRASIHKITLP